MKLECVKTKAGFFSFDQSNKITVGKVYNGQICGLDKRFGASVVCFCNDNKWHELELELFKPVEENNER